MRPTLPCTAALALLGAALSLGAQNAPPTIRKFIDVVDTLGVGGIAEPTSGRFLVYESKTGIHVVNERTGKVTATIPRTSAPVVSYMASGLSISASGRRLAFLASGESSDDVHVWTVDLDTLTGTPVSAPHRVSIMRAGAMDISNDGRFIAFSMREAATSRLVIMPSDGGDEQILDTAANIVSPRFSPDGKTIYYIRGRGHGPALARIPASGGQPDSLTPAIMVIGVSADGQHVAFYPYNGDNRMIVRITDPRGRQAVTFASTTTQFYLTWSRHLPGALLGRAGDWRPILKTVALDNGTVSSFLSSETSGSAPRFSPDGRQVAVTSYVGDREQIVVYDLSSNEPRVLRTAVEPLNWAPDGPSMQWSPDGTHIAFLALDSSFMRHELYAVDVATSRSTRLADLGRAKWSNATLFRWHSDGQSIEYITTDSAHAASLERVTLSGNHSVVTKLPVARQGNATDGGYRLLNDSLIAIGRNPRTDSDSAYLAIVDSRTGTIRTVINKPALWQLSDNSSILSPDGKWIAFGSRGRKDDQPYYEWTVASLDGKMVRAIGERMVLPCMGTNFYGLSVPHQWLPDSRSLIALGVPSCGSNLQVYVVPIDGSPARHLAMPTDYSPDVTLTPDGRRLLVASIKEGSMSIVAVDASAMLGSRAQVGRAGKAGRN